MLLIQVLMTPTIVLFLFEGLTKKEFETTFEVLPEATEWSVVRDVMGTEAAR